MARDFVLGLDLGSTKFRMVVCSVDEQGALEIVGVSDCPSAGVRRGLIVDMDQVVQAIDHGMKRLNSLVFLADKCVITNLMPEAVSFIRNTGYMLSKSRSGQVTYEEQRECVRRSKSIVKSSDQRILHVVPLYFKVDGNQVSQAVGVFGRQVEVMTHMVMVNRNALYELTQGLNRLGCRVEGLAYDGFSTGQVYLSDQERQEGVLLIDFGAEFTRLHYFKDHKLYWSHVIPLGGATLTRDVALCMDVSESEAERLKVVHGDILLQRVDKNKVISVNRVQKERLQEKKYLLCQIIEARMAEWSSLIETALSDAKIHCPHWVVGGGSQSLTGLPEYLASWFQVRVRLGLHAEVRSILEEPAYGNALGLILYGLKVQALPINPISNVNWLEKVRGSVSRLLGLGVGR